MNVTSELTHGSVFKKILGFMLPVFWAMVLQAMYGAVDMLIVGRFGDSAGISGVSTGSGIIQLFTMLVIALTSGVTVMIGHSMGAGRREEIGPVVGSAVMFFSALSIALMIMCVFFAVPTAELMQAPEEALAQTAQYIRICGGGFIFITFYNFISSVFRGLGDSRTPLLLVGAACVVNVIGDLLMVAVLKMNVAGAAAATVAAQAFSVATALMIMRRRGLGFPLSRRDFRFGPEIRRFVAIGAPLAAQSFLTSMSFLAICAFVNRLGLDASSGYGVAQKMQQFVMLVPASLMQSMAPFAAHNAGAGRHDRARQGMLCGMGIGASIGVVIAWLAFFHGDAMAGLFTEDAGVVARAFEYLRGFSSEAVVTSILFSFLGYFSGNGRSLFVMVQGMIQSFLIRLPMSYFMSVLPNASLTGVALAAPTATVFGIAMCIFYFRRMQRQLNR